MANNGYKVQVRKKGTEEWLDFSGPDDQHTAKEADWIVRRIKKNYPRIEARKELAPLQEGASSCFGGF